MTLFIVHAHGFLFECLYNMLCQMSIGHRDLWDISFEFCYLPSPFKKLAALFVLFHFPDGKSY